MESLFWETKDFILDQIISGWKSAYGSIDYSEPLNSVHKEKKLE